ncbi:hypothetical protein AAG570_002309 [Ranatra chinensis]|uniref:F-box only protein 9 n=1 Tax=Ranatra chinensis TaxID=642074 RepID=A0ABD0YJF8_9HEMI
MGVENEEKGRLYEAIQYYRRAFQLVPDIEFKLSQQVYNRPQQRDRGGSTEGIGSDDGGDEDGDGEVTFDPTALDLLTHLQYVMQRSHRRTICSPHNPNKGTHISALPMEIFLYILRWVVSTDLDLRSLEVCSQICRGFYICCRDPEIWRIACTRISSGPSNLRNTIYSSWRDMYIKRPRLHYGGCYISRTTYIRPGENSFQDQFYRPWHLVQYYRYLRFFPDGRVLMLTTVEDPVTSVGLLRSRWPPQRQPPISVGYFRLHDDSTVSLVISESTNNSRNAANSNSAQSHTFHLELEISSHKSRLHGKLVWRGYSVFTRRNGVETNTSFDLESSRYPPFWFSRVKSYTSETRNPLM